MAPGVIFCCCSPSPSSFSVLYIHRCSSANFGCNKQLILPLYSCLPISWSWRLFSSDIWLISDQRIATHVIFLCKSMWENPDSVPNNVAVSIYLASCTFKILFLCPPGPLSVLQWCLMQHGLLTQLQVNKIVLVAKKTQLFIGEWEHGRMLPGDTAEVFRASGLHSWTPH